MDKYITVLIIFPNIGLNVSAGEAEVVKETETAIDEESDVLDTLFEPSKSPLDGDGRNGDMSEVCDKKENSECLEHVILLVAYHFQFFITYLDILS
jgi:hypothetical protein